MRRKRNNSNKSNDDDNDKDSMFCKSKDAQAVGVRHWVNLNVLYKSNFFICLFRPQKKTWYWRKGKCIRQRILCANRDDTRRKSKNSNDFHFATPRACKSETNLWVNSYSHNLPSFCAFQSFWVCAHFHSFHISFVRQLNFVFTFCLLSPVLLSFDIFWKK